MGDSRASAMTEVSKVQIEQKCFTIKRGSMGRLSTVFVKESRKGTSSSCEIDDQGIQWVILQLRREAGLNRSKKEDWTKRTKIGWIWLTRDSNRKGEFLRLSWALDKVKSPRLIIIPRGSNGWTILGDALEGILNGACGSSQMQRGPSNLVAQQPREVSGMISDVDLDRSSLGAWSLALLVEVNSTAVSWSRIGAALAKRFGLEKGFDLYPFLADRAFFFTSTMENLRNFCDNGKWVEENVQVTIRKWFPGVNAIHPPQISKWLSITGVPFNCWGRDSICAILKGLCTVVDIDENSLNFKDLSSIRVLSSNFTENLPLNRRVSIKGLDFWVCIEEVVESDGLKEPEFGKLEIEGGVFVSPPASSPLKVAVGGIDSSVDQLEAVCGNKGTPVNAWSKVKGPIGRHSARLNLSERDYPSSSGSRFGCLSDRSGGSGLVVEETVPSGQVEEGRSISSNGFRPNPNWLFLKKSTGETSMVSLGEKSPSIAGPTDLIPTSGHALLPGPVNVIYSLEEMFGTKGAKSENSWSNTNGSGRPPDQIRDTSWVFAKFSKECAAPLVALGA